MSDENSKHNCDQIIGDSHIPRSGGSQVPVGEYAMDASKVSCCVPTIFCVIAIHRQALRLQDWTVAHIVQKELSKGGIQYTDQEFEDARQQLYATIETVDSLIPVVSFVGLGMS